LQLDLQLTMIVTAKVRTEH